MNVTGMSMANGTAAVAILTSLLWLLLNYRALQAQGLSFETKAKMAVAWIVIISGLAFVLSRIAP